MIIDWQEEFERGRKLQARAEELTEAMDQAALRDKRRRQEIEAAANEAARFPVLKNSARKLVKSPRAQDSRSGRRLKRVNACFGRYW